MRKLFHIILVFLLLSIVSCKQTPSWVIDNDDMEDLLVDVYLSEALSRNNHIVFNSPAKKEKLFNSVLEKHGITRQQFDTSLYWYGENYDVYSKICEKVTERLNKEKKEIEGILAVTDKPIHRSDTADIWIGRRQYATLFSWDYHVLNYKMATDTSFHVKDKYELRMNVFGISEKDSTGCFQMELKLKYKNDSIFSVRKIIEKNGLATLSLSSDSLIPKQISGYISVSPTPQSKYVKIDSIQLLRIRQGERNKKQPKENNHGLSNPIPPDQKMPERPDRELERKIRSNIRR